MEPGARDTDSQPAGAGLKGSLAELTERVAQVSDLYAARCAIIRDDDWFALKLQEECGELIAEYLRLSGRGRAAGGTAAPEALADEAADLLAHLLLFCRRNAVDIETALDRKWFRHLATGPAE